MPAFWLPKVGEPGDGVRLECGADRAEGQQAARQVPLQAEQEVVVQVISSGFVEEPVRVPQVQVHAAGKGVLQAGNVLPVVRAARRDVDPSEGEADSRGEGGL